MADARTHTSTTTNHFLKQTHWWPHMYCVEHNVRILCRRSTVKNCARDIDRQYALPSCPGLSAVPERCVYVGPCFVRVGKRAFFLHCIYEFDDFSGHNKKFTGFRTGSQPSQDNRAGFNGRIVSCPVSGRLFSFFVGACFYKNGNAVLNRSDSRRFF